MADSGFLVCADITGYTQYLSGTELEHASGILSDLLDAVLAEVKAPLHLSRVEGDAVISYAVGPDDLPPHVVLDRIEHTYVAFRRALDQIVANTSCTCLACANIESLDLKFVVHHAEFVVEHVAGQDELVGSDVNLLFRLTKNSISSELGLPGYVALTDEAVAALDLPDLPAETTEHVEADPEAGRVRLHVMDVSEVWEEHRARGGIEIPADDVLVEHTVRFELPAAETWSLLTAPETRALLMDADDMALEELEGGRVGAESVYVCAHGSQTVRQRIVEWDPPFRYVFVSPLVGKAHMLGEFRIAPSGGGSEITYRASKPRGGMLASFLGPIVRRKLRHGLEQGLQRLAERAEGAESD